MTNNLILLFSTLLISGSIISVSSTSLLGAWLGLEINLLAFIPLMNSPKSLSTEASVKYFLIQALASLTFLFGSILSSLHWDPSSFNLIEYMLTITLLMKLGASPFHNWFINISYALTWPFVLVLLTWQKLAPIIILFMIFKSPNFLLPFILISAITGALGGLSQTSLKKLLAFSSINHMSWLFFSMQFSETIFSYYLIIYIMITASIVMVFIQFNLDTLNKMNFMYKSKPVSLIVSFSLLSLGGLPPFLGFFAKWIVINESMLISPMMVFLLILLSLITLIFYMQIILSNIILGSMNHKFYLKTKNHYDSHLFFTITMIFSNLLLPLFFIL